MNDFSALTRKYRIPPAVAEYMDPNQLTIIYSVDQAIQQMKSNIRRNGQLLFWDRRTRYKL
jgi:hypothetical protein